MTDGEYPLPRTAARARRFRILLLAVGLSATIAIPFALGGWGTLFATSRIPPSGYAGLLGLVLLTCTARAAKLHLLLRRMGAPTPFIRSFGISLATDLAFTVTPVGAGGYIANVYYLRREGASVSGAVTITAIDQGMDLVFFAIAVPIAALAVAGSGLSATTTTLAAVASVLSASLPISLWFARKRILSWLSGANSFWARWAQIDTARRALRKFLTHLRTDMSMIITAPRPLLAGMLCLTTVQWSARYGVLWLTLSLLGHTVPFAVAFLLQVVVLHAALWTGVPAGAGGAELGLTGMFAYSVRPSQMATALLVWRAATLYTSLIAGAAAMVMLARRRNVAYPGSEWTYGHGCRPGAPTAGRNQSPGAEHAGQSGNRHKFPKQRTAR